MEAFTYFNRILKSCKDILTKPEVTSIIKTDLGYSKIEISQMRFRKTQAVKCKMCISAKSLRFSQV